MPPPLWLSIIMLNCESAFEGSCTFMSVRKCRGREREREERREGREEKSQSTLAGLAGPGVLSK